MRRIYAKRKRDRGEGEGQARAQQHNEEEEEEQEHGEKAKERESEESTLIVIEEDATGAIGKNKRAKLTTFHVDDDPDSLAITVLFRDRRPNQVLSLHLPKDSAGENMLPSWESLHKLVVDNTGAKVCKKIKNYNYKN